MLGEHCKWRTAAGLVLLAAALSPACGDDDPSRSAGRARDGGRDARSDAPDDATAQPDSAHEAGSDAGSLDADLRDARVANDAADGSRDAARETGSDAHADSEAGADASRDAAVDQFIVPPLDASADASDASTNLDSGLLDSGADAESEATVDAGEPLVFWRVGESFVCEATREQVRCLEDESVGAYVVRILQPQGSSCPQGPSSIVFYFQSGSPPPAGQYTINPDTTLSVPFETRLDLDVEGAGQSWSAQSGTVNVELVDGSPSLRFSGIPARFDALTTTLKGRVTCPPDS